MATDWTLVSEYLATGKYLSAELLLIEGDGVTLSPQDQLLLKFFRVKLCLMTTRYIDAFEIAEQLSSNVIEASMHVESVVTLLLDICHFSPMGAFCQSVVEGTGLRNDYRGQLILAIVNKNGTLLNDLAKSYQNETVLLMTLRAIHADMIPKSVATAIVSDLRKYALTIECKYHLASFDIERKNFETAESLVRNSNSDVLEAPLMAAVSAFVNYREKKWTNVADAATCVLRENLFDDWCVFFLAIAHRELGEEEIAQELLMTLVEESHVKIAARRAITAYHFRKLQFGKMLACAFRFGLYDGKRKWESR